MLHSSSTCCWVLKAMMGLEVFEFKLLHYALTNFWVARCVLIILLLLTSCTLMCAQPHVEFGDCHSHTIYLNISHPLQKLFCVHTFIYPWQVRWNIITQYFTYDYICGVIDLIILLNGPNVKGGVNGVTQFVDIHHLRQSLCMGTAILHQSVKTPPLPIYSWEGEFWLKYQSKQCPSFN